MVRRYRNFNNCLNLLIIILLNHLFFLKIHKYIDVNTGYMKNLKKYKVKRAKKFNVLKIGRERISVDTVSGLPEVLRTSNNSSFQGNASSFQAPN